VHYPGTASEAYLFIENYVSECSHYCDNLPNDCDKSQKTSGLEKYNRMPSPFRSATEQLTEQLWNFIISMKTLVPYTPEL